MKTKIAGLRYRGLKLLRNHQVFVALVLVLTVATVVVVRISMLNALPVDQDTIDDATAKLVPVRFDQAAIDKMEELQESNVRVPGAQLPQNRRNPFSE